MKVEITETAIIAEHGDPVPRFSAFYTNVLKVAEGETFVLPENSEYDAIEVSGTLKVSREHDTTCKVTHFTILPTGTLDIGTEADPVLKKVNIIFKDVPLDTGTVEAPGKDPFQFGNGLIVYGKLLSYGIKLDNTFTQLKAKVEANADKVFVDVPMGWKSGDKLLIPDTRRPYYEYPTFHSSRKEDGIEIKSIENDVVSLNKGLSFSRELFTDLDGNVRHMPYVANATRNITFKSENPNGTRGHVIFLLHAHVDIWYTAFEGLGRTLAINLDSTKSENGIITHIGTNQIARYAVHWHHVHGHANVNGYTGRIVGCYLDGNNIGKWGVVQHGTHDLYIAENVGYNFPSGVFVTEDGYEVRGTYNHNFAMGCTGNGVNGKFNFVPPNNNPGGEGAGFWFHGMKQIITNNVSINNSVGYEFLYRNQATGNKVPEVPGGPNILDIDPTIVTPIKLENNFALCCKDGIEVWNNPKLVFTKIYLYNNYTGYTAGNGEGGRVDLDDFHIISDGKKVLGYDTAISTSAAYTGDLELKNGEISGYWTGIVEVRNNLFVTNVVMQNKTNFNYHFFRPAHTILDNVEHKQYKNEPKRFIVLGQGQDWKVGEPLPYAPYAAPMTPSDDQRFIVKNWQKSGKDYLLYENQQRRSKPAWYIASHGIWYIPVPGLTMGEAFDRFGLAYGGSVIDDADAVELDGLIYGVGRLGTTPKLGVPKATLVYPNILSKATLYGEEPKNGNLDYHFYLSNNGNADGKTFFTVDNSEPIEVGPWYNQWHGTSRVRDRVEFTTSGTHTVNTWRVDLNGNKIEGSDLTFKYFVGEVEPPVEPTPIVVSPITVTPEVVYESTTAKYTATATGGDAPLIWKTKYTYGNTTIDHSAGTGNSAEWTFNYPAGARKYIWSITFTDGTQSTTVTKEVNVLAKPTDNCVELQAKIVELNNKITELEAQIAADFVVKTTLQTMINTFKVKIKQVEQLRLELLEMSK